MFLAALIGGGVSGAGTSTPGVRGPGDYLARGLVEG